MRNVLPMGIMLLVRLGCKNVFRYTGKYFLVSITFPVFGLDFLNIKDIPGSRTIDTLSFNLPYSFMFGNTLACCL